VAVAKTLRSRKGTAGIAGEWNAGFSRKPLTEAMLRIVVRFVCR
jgi:hypothetical protein